ncbi:MAG: hypothetical protein QXO57_02570 [Candidatus Aenigmatarchaeota archaeon]
MAYFDFLLSPTFLNMLVYLIFIAFILYFGKRILDRFGLKAKKKAEPRDFTKLRLLHRVNISRILKGDFRDLYMQDNLTRRFMRIGRIVGFSIQELPILTKRGKKNERVVPEAFISFKEIPIRFGGLLRLFRFTMILLGILLIGIFIMKFVSPQVITYITRWAWVKIIVDLSLVIGIAYILLGIFSPFFIIRMEGVKIIRTPVKLGENQLIEFSGNDIILHIIGLKPSGTHSNPDYYVPVLPSKIKELEVEYSEYVLETERVRSVAERLFADTEKLITTASQYSPIQSLTPEDKKRSIEELRELARKMRGEE